MRYKAAVAVAFAGLMALLVPRPASAAWSGSVSISYFHQELSPYGRWVVTSYGEVWRPTVVAADWEPYVDGEWVYTDCGWTWVSYDPFGGDPFHYGTWVWVDPYGWCWEPGFIWGPAWVTWAYTDSYIGWAPLPPTFDITVSGYAGSPITVPQNQYVFVPINNFVGTTVSSVRVPVQQNADILASAQKATRFTVSGGLVRASDPPASLVERATGTTLHRTSLTSHKLRPTTIAAAGVVSGKKFGIVAPARERAIAAKQARPSGAKVAQKAAPSRGSKSLRANAGRSAATSRRPSRAVKEKPPRSQRPTHAQKAAKAAPRNAPSAHAKAATTRERPAREVRGKESKPLHPEGKAERGSSVAAAPAGKGIRRERAPEAPAPRASEKRRENPPAAVKREQRPIAMNSPQRERPAAPHSAAPPPEASQAHPAAPPAAAAKPPQGPPAQPQPQGPPAGGKKEKQKE